MIKSGWETTADGRMKVDIVIPPNTTAEVELPDAVPDTIRENGIPWAETAGIGAAQPAAVGAVRFEHGSGSFPTASPTSAIDHSVLPRKVQLLRSLLPSFRGICLSEGNCFYSFSIRQKKNPVQASERPFEPRRDLSVSLIRVRMRQRLCCQASQTSQV